MRKLLVIADFPVPVGPTYNEGVSCEMYKCRKKLCRTVSVVGMMISLN